MKIVVKAKNVFQMVAGELRGRPWTGVRGENREDFSHPTNRNCFVKKETNMRIIEKLIW